MKKHELEMVKLALDKAAEYLKDEGYKPIGCITQAALIINTEINKKPLTDEKIRKQLSKVLNIMEQDVNDDIWERLIDTKKLIQYCKSISK